MNNPTLRNLPDSTRLLVVSKGRTSEEVQQVVKTYGSNLVGASRWQESRSKFFVYDQMSNNSYPLSRREWAESLELHFIGRLQSNKLKYLVPHFDCIQSVATQELLFAIDEMAEKQGKVQKVMLQVNVSDDSNKAGIEVEGVSTVVHQAKLLKHVKVIGLMTITALQNEEETARDFRAMKELQVKLELPELSMGMSSDWQIAIEEGATIIRVGSALYN